MKRRLLNLLTALSLLLCAAVCVLWVRSGGRWESVSRLDWQADRLTYEHRSLNSSSGRLWFHGGAGSLNPDAAAREEEDRRRGHPWPPNREWVYASLPPRVPNAGLEFLGFHFIRTHDRAPDGKLTGVLWVGVPHALPAALALMLPAARAGGWLRHRRRRQRGACRVCGYGLRATPGRCPECGTEPSFAEPERRTARPEERDGGSQPPIAQMNTDGW